MAGPEPAALVRAREAAVAAEQRANEEEARARRFRRAAINARTTYENLLLEYQGQLTLFNEEGT